MDQNRTAEQTLTFLTRMAAAAASIAGALIALAIAAERNRQLKLGLGEVDIKTLVRTLDIKHGETLNYCEFSASEFDYIKNSDVLKDCGVRNFSFVGSANSDTVQVFYGSKDICDMDNVKQAAEAAVGRRSEISNKAFQALAKNRQTTIVSGLTPEQAEILRSTAPQNGNFPYTVVDNPRMEGLTVICCSEDKDKLMANLRAVCTAELPTLVFEAQDGDSLETAAEHNIRVRSENKKLISNAKNGDVFIDAQNPGSRVEVSKKGFAVYNNGKLLHTLPRRYVSMNLVCNTVFEMKDPIKMTYESVKDMTLPERQDYIAKHPDNFLRLEKEAPLNVSADTLAKEYERAPQTADIKMNKFRIYDSPFFASESEEHKLNETIIPDKTYDPVTPGKEGDAEL